MKSGNAVLGCHSETMGITEKSDMKRGQKCDPLLKEMFKCRI